MTDFFRQSNVRFKDFIYRHGSNLVVRYLSSNCGSILVQYGMNYSLQNKPGMDDICELVSTKWLSDVIKDHNNKSIAILDCSWHMPQTNRNARKEFEEKHIPGALYFDIDECADRSSSYAHMLPNTEEFEQYVGNLGIDANKHVIVYDNSPDNGFFSAPRVWWMFRVFGHSAVSILNGGLQKWSADGLPTTSEATSPVKSMYKGNYQAKLVINYDDIVKNLSEKTFQVVDTLHEGFFTGKDPSPIEGLGSGHILGAMNLVYTKLIDKEKGIFADRKVLAKIIAESGVDLSKPIIASCGTGVTACCLALAAHICDIEVPVYDGSWMEYYQRSTAEMRVCPSEKRNTHN